MYKEMSKKDEKYFLVIFHTKQCQVSEHKTELKMPQNNEDTKQNLGIQILKKSRNFEEKTTVSVYFFILRTI